MRIVVVYHVIVKLLCSLMCITNFESVKHHVILSMLYVVISNCCAINWINDLEVWPSDNNNILILIYLFFQVRFSDIFAEPDQEVHSFDKVWVLSFKVIIFKIFIVVYPNDFMSSLLCQLAKILFVFVNFT